MDRRWSDVHPTTMSSWKILLISLLLAAHVQQIDTVGGRGVAISSKGNRMSIGAKPVDADEDSGTLTVILVVILPVAQMFAVLLLIIFIRMFYRCLSNTFRKLSCFCCRCCCCLNEDGSGSGPQSKNNQKRDKKTMDKTKKSKSKNLHGHKATAPITATTTTNNNNNKKNIKNPSKHATTAIPLTVMNRYQCYVPEAVQQQQQQQPSIATTRMCSPSSIGSTTVDGGQPRQKYHSSLSNHSNTGSSSSAATTKCPPPPPPSSSSSSILMRSMPMMMDDCVLQIENIATNDHANVSASTSSCVNVVADRIGSIPNHNVDDVDVDSQCPYFIHKNDQYSAVANENGIEIDGGGSGLAGSKPNPATVQAYQKPKLMKSQDRSMIMMVIDDEFDQNQNLDSSSINGLEDLIDDDDDDDDDDDFHENGQFAQLADGQRQIQCTVSPKAIKHNMIQSAALKIQNKNPNKNPSANNVINCCDPLQHQHPVHPGLEFNVHNHHSGNMMLMWNSLMNYHQRPLTTFRPTTKIYNSKPTTVKNKCPHTY